MPVTNISNGTIIDISSQRNNTFVTVRYRCQFCNRGNEEIVVLVVGPRTLILDDNGVPVSVRELRVGMIVNATIATAMTRSIPPQAQAYMIRVVRSSQADSVTSGRILNIDRRNRSFTLLSGNNFSDIIQVNVSGETAIFNRFGRPIRFEELMSGMRVRVRHANFMTASIPPQTTAFEIRVL